MLVNDHRPRDCDSVSRTDSALLILIDCKHTFVVGLVAGMQLVKSSHQTLDILVVLSRKQLLISLKLLDLSDILPKHDSHFVVLILLAHLCHPFFLLNLEFGLQLELVFFDFVFAESQIVYSVRVLVYVVNFISLVIRGELPGLSCALKFA